MGKLTENVIYQKIKTCPTDLSKIKQLNVSGRDLTDVSIIKELAGLEMLSLSYNNISSLVYFENCKNLRSLYLRCNQIKDLSEIKYLVNLPKLEVLSLAENPCAEEPLYRPTVIKHLKTLIQLDDIPIEDDERNEAEFTGSQIPRLYSTANAAMKSSTTIEAKKTPCEQFWEGGSMEDANTEPPNCSKLKSGKSRFNCTEFTPGSLFDMNFSQSRLLQQSRMDFGTTSLLDLSVTGGPIMPSRLLLAVLFMVKDLGYSDLQILRRELVSMLNAMTLQYWSE